MILSQKAFSLRLKRRGLAVRHGRLVLWLDLRLVDEVGRDEAL